MLDLQPVFTYQVREDVTSAHASTHLVKAAVPIYHNMQQLCSLFPVQSSYTILYNSRLSLCLSFVFGLLPRLSFRYSFIERRNRGSLINRSSIGCYDVLYNMPFMARSRPAGNNRHHVAGSQRRVRVMDQVVFWICIPLRCHSSSMLLTSCIWHH